MPVTEALVDRARTLAWNHALRGYDAVQLASALVWQESVGMEIVFGTFDTAALDGGAAGGYEGLAGGQRPDGSTEPAPDAETE